MSGTQGRTVAIRRVFARLPLLSVKRAGGLSMARAVTQLGTFAATAAVGRVLGPASLGEYAVYLSIGAIVVGGIGSGIPVLALRETAAGRATPAFHRGVAVTMLLVTGVAVGVAAVIGMLVMDGTRGLTGGLVAGAANLTFAFIALGSAVHAGRGAYRRAAIGEASAGCAIAALTVAALAAGWGVPGALAAMVAGGLVGVALLWWRAVPARATEARGRSSPRGTVFRQSLPFIALGIGNASYLRVDAVLLGAVASRADVGIYASAYRAISPFSLLIAGFTTVFLSRIAQEQLSDHEWHRLRKKGRLLLAGCLFPIVAVCVLLAPWGIRLVYGRSFDAAVTPARLLLLSVLPLAWYLPSAAALTAAGRERTWMAIQGCGLLVDVVLVTVLGSAHGANGGAVAWLVAETTVLAIVTVFLRRRRRRPRPPGPDPEPVVPAPA